MGTVNTVDLTNEWAVEKNESHVRHDKCGLFLLAGKKKKHGSAQKFRDYCK